MKNIGMSKLTVLSIMEKAVRYQKHGLAKALATTLWLDMMKSIMGKSILPSLKHMHWRILLKVSL
jgi:hypothetical protein